MGSEFSIKNNVLAAVSFFCSESTLMTRSKTYSGSRLADRRHRPSAVSPAIGAKCAPPRIREAAASHDYSW